MQQQQWRRSGKKERQDETQFITRMGGKTSLGPSYFVLGEFSFPVTCLMPYYAQNWPFSSPNHVTLRTQNQPFSSPNHVTLRITLMHCVHWQMLVHSGPTRTLYHLPEELSNPSLVGWMCSQMDHACSIVQDFGQNRLSLQAYQRQSHFGSKTLNFTKTEDDTQNVHQKENNIRRNSNFFLNLGCFTCLCVYLRLTYVTRYLKDLRGYKRPT